MQAGSADQRSVMEAALDEARIAGARGEVPVGAVVLDQAGRIVSRAGNRVEALRDASAHAELLALRDAARTLDTRHLVGCTLVSSLEPCAMCAAAAAHFRISRVLFGAYDPKGGAIENGPRLYDQPGWLHRPESIGGLCETESARLLRDFFAARRRAAAAG